MKELIFEKYQYTDDDKLLDNANRIAFGEEILDSITVVESEKIEYNWTMDEVNAIMHTIAELTKEKNLGSFTSGNYLGLLVILNADTIQDMKHEDWHVLYSPRLSCKKIAHLTGFELVSILISLNEHRELWIKGKSNDASIYFS